MWFDRSTRIEYHSQSQGLDVTVPNRFVADWINKHFIEDLRRAAREELGDGVNLNLHVRGDRFASTASTSVIDCDGGVGSSDALSTPANCDQSGNHVTDRSSQYGTIGTDQPIT